MTSEYTSRKTGKTIRYDFYAMNVRKATAERMKKLCDKHGMKYTAFASAAIDHYCEQWKRYEREIKGMDKEYAEIVKG